jgi:hypothetical protein
LAGSANDVSYRDECRNKVGIAARTPDQFAGSVAGRSEPWASTLQLKCTAQPSDLSRHAERDQTIRADKLGPVCPESGVVDHDDCDLYLRFQN